MRRTDPGGYIGVVEMLYVVAGVKEHVGVAVAAAAAVVAEVVDNPSFVVGAVLDALVKAVVAVWDA